MISWSELVECLKWIKIIMQKWGIIVFSRSRAVAVAVAVTVAVRMQNAGISSA